MTQINLSTPVGDFVAQHPQTSRVFEALQIDYCCNGGTPLEQACASRQLDPQEVIQQLQQAIATTDEPANNWLSAPLAELCDHIEQTHHAYLRSELPRLTDMICKVVQAHGSSHPELSQLEQIFAGLRAELEPHLFKEEQVLFPAIRLLEQSATTPSFPFGTIGNPVRMMEHEHEQAGEALLKIRQTTSNFQVPDGACNTYRAMLDGLHQLEIDLHKHIHKENSILFPRAVELGQTRSAG